MRIAILTLGNEERVNEDYWQKFKPLAEAIWAKDAHLILVVGGFAYGEKIDDPFNFRGAASGITTLAAQQKILELARQHHREVQLNGFGPRKRVAERTELSFHSSGSEIGPQMAQMAQISDQGFQPPSVASVPSVADRLGNCGWNADPVALSVSGIRVALRNPADQAPHLNPPSLDAESSRECVDPVADRGGARRVRHVPQGRVLDSQPPFRTSCRTGRAISVCGTDPSSAAMRVAE